MDEKQKKLAEELLFSGEKKPSFAKMLYFGILDSDRVFPFPKLASGEREKVDEMLQKLNEFADKEIDADAIDRQAAIPHAVIHGLAEMGILGMTVPKEYGGLGMSQMAYCKVMEALAQKCVSTALYVNVHQSIGLKSLLLFGTDKQKNQWLKPLALGECTAAFALTEANAGSDAGGVETTAEYDEEKKCYRINGRKQWITNGGIAKVLTVMAKTNEKITAFLVTPDMAGFKVETKALEKVGMKGTWTAVLTFDNMEVPEENIIGPKGSGLRVALTVLDFGRITFGSTCTAMAKFCVERAVEYAKRRHQFDRPLASFPLVKKKLACMAAYTYAMDAATLLTAGLLDSGEHDVMLEAAILKVFASEASWKILYDTMQIYGGKSFFTDQPFERLMRDARLNMIGEGANEVLQAFIGVVGMRDVGVQMKGARDSLANPLGDMGELWRFLKTTYYRMSAPKVPVKSADIQKEASRLGKSIKRFGSMIARLLVRHKEEIIEKQLLLDRVANGAAALYTSSAVLSKVDSEIQAGEKGNVETAKLYVLLALDKFDREMETMFDNRDEEIEALSDKLSGIAE